MAATLDLLLGKIDGTNQRLDGLQEQHQIEQARQQERLRTRKKIKFKFRATGANPFSAGGDAAVQSGGIVLGPDAGFFWALRSLTIQGLTTGATPDIVNIFVGSALGDYLWQLNGNSPGQTWGRGEMPLWAGDFLFFQSVGTFNATGTITFRGVADQVAGELQGELM